MQSDSYAKVRKFVLVWNQAQSLKEVADLCNTTEQAASNKAMSLRRKGIVMKKMPYVQPRGDSRQVLTTEEYAQLKRLSLGQPELLHRPRLKPAETRTATRVQMERLHASDAAMKPRNQITLKDAMEFWALGIPATGALLAEVEGQTDDGEVRVLIHLHHWMQERFRIHLEVEE